ncbi:BglG family transcription antiterminator LicT [Caldisalinibacter kiritimatiensis]|uniref:Beta-glucoside bgl operon antiterminator, BglG family n=1 Tax=Caldisalinibacter kiritimatiensis TaxID=1304284 RepID=R1CWW6_9FIRM|nr:PRD domain-containing protein [Caldisalinibacter kiritimatiensis]EOD01119.1 Beta-glucoside bgl operon antiterminator, BglG family [Caldisalinibacter kiritimatiensis]
MKIQKILNNNVITTVDEMTGMEKVVMGRGIAFQKKKGDVVDADRIEKVFLIENENENRKFQSLFNKIPLEYIKVTEKIISYAKERLDNTLDEHIYVALTDHLAFAIKRTKAGIRIQNHLMWEIKRFYKKEYEIGQWGIGLVKEELSVELPDDEAGFIAFHLLSASMGENMMNTMDITEMVQDILNIIKYDLKVEFKPGDLLFDRLLTHLRYFAQRVINKKYITEEEEPFYDFIKNNYKQAFNCSLKVKLYVEKNYEYEVSKEEIVYLSLHLQRVISRFKN